MAASVPVVEAALSALRAALGSRLVAVVLAGSHAADRARPGSDVNLIVVADGLPPPGPERRGMARSLGRDFLWAGHGRLTMDLLAPDEVGAAEPGDYRVLVGAGTDAVARLLPEREFTEEGGLWTSRLPS
jgi:predicted nucleotidyltransferase